MHKNDKDTLEFTSRLESDAEKARSAVTSNRDLKNEGIVRTAYRLPVDPTDPIQLIINGHAYSLMNISGRGAQIACSEADGFAPEQVLESMELIIENEPLALTGEVVYSTFVGPEHCVCGIYFQVPDEADQQRLEDYLNTKRKQIFPSKE